MAIRSFKSKALADLWSLGDPAGLPAPLIQPLTQTLHRLDAANKLRDVALMGLTLRTLADGRYAVQIAPTWDVTFAHDWFFLAIDLERRVQTVGLR